MKKKSPHKKNLPTRSAAARRFQINQKVQWPHNFFLSLFFGCGRYNQRHLHWATRAHFNLILILFNFYVIIILVEDHARTRLSQCAAPPPVSAIDMAHHHALVCMRIGAEVRNKAQRSSSGCGWALVQMAVGPMHASKTCNAKRSRTRWRSRRAPPPLSPLSQFHKGLPLCSG